MRGFAMQGAAKLREVAGYAIRVISADSPEQGNGRGYRPVVPL